MPRVLSYCAGTSEAGRGRGRWAGRRAGGAARYRKGCAGRSGDPSTWRHGRASMHTQSTSAGGRRATRSRRGMRSKGARLHHALTESLDAISSSCFLSRCPPYFFLRLCFNGRIEVFSKSNLVDLQADPRRFTYVTTIKEHILEKKHGSTVTKHDCRHGASLAFLFFHFCFVSGANCLTQ